MSTVTGNIVAQAAAIDKTIPGHVIASALAVILGGIVFAIGILRLGRFTEIITLSSITAFMTGSAINIAVGQVPSLLGISKDHVNNRDSTYLVVIGVLKNLRWAGLDAAMGVSALAMLYIIRSFFNYMAKVQPERKRLWFFLNTLRTAFVILLYTLISYLANMNVNWDVKKAKFAILGIVPRGFQDAGVPQVNEKIINLFASQIPVGVIVLLIEHISISKSFGRVNNYRIDPSQELIAIGITNLLGPFVGAYPATGSFSRTAIKSKAGVRTPLAGVITGIVVLIAIYALTAVFFYIPSASLSAVIIHAVGDLITPPNTVYQFWRVSPVEFVIFFAGVFTIIFSSIDNGVYVTMAASAALYVVRLFWSQGRALGRVKVKQVTSSNPYDDKHGTESSTPTYRSVFIPTDHGDGSNPSVEAASPYPGVFIYRLTEGFNFPNANNQLEHMTEIIFSATQRTNPNAYARPGDRPWNDPAPRKGKDAEYEESKPTLKAVIIDFASVNNTDVTSLQALIDVRNQLDRYASPDRVQWHFAGVTNRWTKRALVSAGFGLPPSEGTDHTRWQPLYSVAEIGGSFSAAADAEERQNARRNTLSRGQDVERGQTSDNISASSSHGDSNSVDKHLAAVSQRPVGKTALVHGLNRPFFHVDLESALDSTIHHIEAHGGSREGSLSRDLKEVV
jgi:sodium-independent sulfate anion transporter 11